MTMRALHPSLRSLGFLVATLVGLGALGCSSSDDHGSTGAWEILEIPTKADFYGIQFLDSHRGYLVGGGVFVEGGLIGQTTDGGQSWEFDSGLVSKRRGVSSFAFTGLWFFDDQHAFLIGHGGVLLRCYTGWKQFERVRSGERVSAHLGDLFFADERCGWAIGENGLLGTLDGGENWGWVRKSSAKTGYFSGRAIHFVDRKRGHLVGRHGKLKRSFDGGNRWEDPESKPVPDDGPHLFGLHFADPEHGWTVGEDGTIWHTIDAGANWQAQVSGVRDDLMDVQFIDLQRGWAVGSDREPRRGVILGTQDGGASWVIEMEVPGEEFNTLCALSTGEVWVVGKHVGKGRQKLLRRIPPPSQPEG